MSEREATRIASTSARVLVLAILALVLSPRLDARAATSSAREVVVGSKAFTESIVLAQLAAVAIDARGIDCRVRAQLGGTRVVWDALLGGQIDVYPEYTGTLRRELLVDRLARYDGDIDRALAELGLAATRPLGFDDGYAIGMTAERAQALGVSRISDLREHPDLRLGFSNEFMDRGDGWPGLRARYRLPQRDVRGLQHDLAYRALTDGAIDATDLYATDAEIRHYDLVVLSDDLGYFPRYDALFVYRRDLAERSPPAIAALDALAGRIDARTMIDMNAAVLLAGRNEAGVAADFARERLGLRAHTDAESRRERLARTTGEQLVLVGTSLTAAILVAIPLGIFAARSPRASRPILTVVAVVQTIPSLALLVFMIPLLGIGTAPALAALFLYSLLPIVRNTYSGLHDVDPVLLESADAMGLPSTARLVHVELPLAARSILAGIKTSAVINVGTATLGALIGAGGYGQPILTGIRLDDLALVLEGAVPAALMAWAVQAAFDVAERRLLPRGLRLASTS